MGKHEGDEIRLPKKIAQVASPFILDVFALD